MARTGGIAIGLALVLAVSAACGGKPAPRDPVPTRTKAEVTADVQAQADQLAKIVGQPLENRKVDSAPCVYRKKTNDGSVVVMQGSYHITLPEADHLSAAAKVREAWKAAGYKVIKDTTKDKTVEMGATTPNQFTVRMFSSDPPKALLVLVQSPCFHSSAA